VHDHVSDFFDQVVSLDLESHVDHLGGFGLREHGGSDGLGKDLLFRFGVMDCRGGLGWGVVFLLFESFRGVD
jgi:hypothetical protein